MMLNLYASLAVFLVLPYIFDLLFRYFLTIIQLLQIYLMSHLLKLLYIEIFDFLLQAAQVLNQMLKLFYLITHYLHILSYLFHMMIKFQLVYLQLLLFFVHLNMFQQLQASLQPLNMFYIVLNIIRVCLYPFSHFFHNDFLFL